MSKVSFSRELLGTIRFVFDKTKSRTLNATQAYDKSPSQIVLASYPATSTIKGPTKSLGKVVPYVTSNYVPYVTSNYNYGFALGYGSVAVTATQSPTSTFGLKSPEDPAAPFNSVTVSWTDLYILEAAKKQIVPTITPTGTAIFTAFEFFVDPGSAKSNATKDIFAGNITVATGLYRDWQNKYAVLKVDLLTNKAILRVYNE